MSRPFSYNDENFTVIGNVLFVHFKFEKAYKGGELMIEIPPKIYDRLLFYSNTATTCYHRLEGSGGDFQLTVTERDGKHYFYSNSDLVSYNDRYIYTILILKDI